MRSLPSITEASFIKPVVEFTFITKVGSAYVFTDADISQLGTIAQRVKLGGGLGKVSNYTIDLKLDLDVQKAILADIPQSDTRLKIQVNSDTFSPHHGKVLSYKRDSSNLNFIKLTITDRIFYDNPKFPVASITDSFSNVHPEEIDADAGEPFYYGDESKRDVYFTATDSTVVSYLGPKGVSSEYRGQPIYHNNEITDQSTDRLNWLLTNYQWNQESVADNNTTLAITNDSATTNDLMTVTSSGTTSGSLVNLTSTGTIITTGSILEMVADSATTSGSAGDGRGVVTLSVDALTTGIGMNITSLSNEALAAGVLFQVEHSYDGSADTAITAAIVNIESSVTESGTSSQDYDVMSLLRTSIHDTGGTLTAAGSVLKLENVATETDATLADTVIGLEIVMDADGTGAGIDITHSATSGKVLNMTASATDEDGVIQLTANAVTTGLAMVIDANGLTTGTMLELSTTGTVITTGEVLSIIANSATTATALVRVSGTSLSNGWAMELTGGGTNITSTGGVLNIACGANTDGNAIQVISTGNFLSTADELVVFTADSMTTGDVLGISASAQTTGNLISLVGGAATMASGGALIRADMGAATAGSGLEIVTTGAYVDTTDGVLNVTANTATNGNIVIVNATAAIAGTLLELNATGGTLTTGNYLVCNDASLDVFAVKLWLQESQFFGLIQEIQALVEKP